MSFVIRGGKSLVLLGTGLGVVENGQKGGTKGKVDPLRNIKSRHPQLQHKAIFPTSSLSHISTSLPHSFVLCHHFLLFVTKSCSISSPLYSLPQSLFTTASSLHTFSPRRSSRSPAVCLFTVSFLFFVRFFRISRYIKQC